MENKNKKTSLYVLATVLILIGAIIIAGKLTPVSGTASVVSTLDAIYQKTQNFGYSDAPKVKGNPSDTSDLNGVMQISQQIWDSLSANSITPDIIVAGNTVLGVVGTAVVGGPSLEWYPSDKNADYASGPLVCAQIINPVGTKQGSWRMPTAGELLSKFEETNSLPAGFTPNTAYWTSSHFHTYYYYYINMSSGYLNYYGPADPRPMGVVRCVR